MFTLRIVSILKSIYFRFQTNTTTDMLFTIVSIQPKESSIGGGETRESLVERQAKEMLGKLPKDFDPYDVKDRLVFYILKQTLAHMNVFLITD